MGAGEIGQLWGLADVRIGDPIGAPPDGAVARSFAPPTLETVVVPRTPADRRMLRVALEQLAEQDPLIGLRQDGEELSVALYGEVQKEVVQATLAADFGVDVTFRESTTICVERPVGQRRGVRDRSAPTRNPLLATVGLRVEPGTGVTFGLEVELGSMPAAFFNAVEETVRATLERLARDRLRGDHDALRLLAAPEPRAPGVQQVDVEHRRATSARLTPLVLAHGVAAGGHAGARAGASRSRSSCPADTVGPVLREIAQLGGLPGATTLDGPTAVVEGDVPAARVHALRTQLPGLTRGEALLETAFDRYEPVSGRRGR